MTKDLKELIDNIYQLATNPRDTNAIIRMIEIIHAVDEELLVLTKERDDSRWWAKKAIDEIIEERDKARRERDEARRVLEAIVEEFVQHAQAMNPFYPATPHHECEFSWSPERGKCAACEAWGDYVLICHPLWETDEEETL
jgi:hypothetical protein